MAPSPAQWLVFDTHPIQYRSPVFRSLASKLSGLEVYYFNAHFRGDRPWFHEVGTIPNQPFNVELRDGFVSHVMNSDRGIFRYAGHVWRILRQRRPKGVVMYGWYLPEHWILWLMCRLQRIPLIFIGETFSEGIGWRRRLKQLLYPLFFGGIAAVVAIGKKTRQFYESLKIQKERIVGARYCTDTRFFELPTEEALRLRTQVREELGIGPTDFVVLFVGRLFQRKRPLDMVEMHRVLQNDNFHTLMVGNGQMESELRNRVGQLFGFHLLGFKDQPSLRAYYHASDLLLVPSEYETWGLVVNEAFATGTPAVVTDTCGCAGDLVVDGETGFVYPVGDIQAACRHIERLQRDPQLLSQLGLQAKGRVVQKYSVDQFAEAMKTALQRTSARGFAK